MKCHWLAPELAKMSHISVGLLVGVLTVCASPVFGEGPSAKLPTDIIRLADSCDGIFRELLVDLLRVQQHSESLPFTAVDSYGTPPRMPDATQLAQVMISGKYDVVIGRRLIDPATHVRLGEHFKAQIPFPPRLLMIGAAQVIVNQKNPLKRVTSAQLGQIFQGQTLDWQAISKNGPQGKIERWMPAVSRHEVEIFRRTALAQERFDPVLSNFKVQPFRQLVGDAQVINAVAKDVRAIGILRAYPGQKLDKRVRAVPVSIDEKSEAFLPTEETLWEDKYPLRESVALWVHPEANAVAREFIDFATSEAGGDVLRRHRYWPVSDRDKLLASQRQLAAKQGKGPNVHVCGGLPEQSLMRDIANEFVVARDPIQLKYTASSQSESMEQFLKEGELLVRYRGINDDLIKRHGAKLLRAFPQAVPVGKLTVGIIANRANKTDWLTMDELRGLFTGRIHNWTVLRGADGEIKRYGLRGNLLVTQLFRERVLRGSDGNRLEWKDKQEQVISAIALDKNGIGFVNLATVPAELGSIKILGVLAPGKLFVENTQHEIPADYPLTETLMVYVSPKAKEQSRAFADFICGSRAGRVLRSHGLFPLGFAVGQSQDQAPSAGKVKR